jgi:hypothetical protein
LANKKRLTKQELEELGELNPKHSKEKLSKISDEQKQQEIEELEGLFEDEGDPQFQFAKLFYERDKNINFKTDLDKTQLRCMPKAEIAESFIIDEYDLDKDDLKIESLILMIKEEAVSKKRLGRVEAPKFISRGEEIKKKGLLQRILGAN